MIHYAKALLTNKTFGSLVIKFKGKRNDKLGNWVFGNYKHSNFLKEKRSK